MRECGNYLDTYLNIWWGTPNGHAGASHGVSLSICSPTVILCTCISPSKLRLPLLLGIFYSHAWNCSLFWHFLMVLYLIPAVHYSVREKMFCVHLICCVQGRAEQVCRGGDIPGGGHPAARDHVRTDQLLGPPGHGLLRTQVAPWGCTFFHCCGSGSA